MQEQRLGNLVAHPHRGIERRRWVLWHETDAVAAQTVEGWTVEAQEIFGLEQHPALLDAGIVVAVAQKCQSRGGLAAARFPDETQDLAAVDVKTHVMQDLGPSFARAEGQRQIFDLHEPRHC